MALPRGEVLRGGDMVVASDGRVFDVVAAPEKLLHVVCADATALARAAYHLGNRHVAVQVGDGFLRLAHNHVLETMLRGLGASPGRVSGIVRVLHSVADSSKLRDREILVAPMTSRLRATAFSPSRT